jgi:hypothetical protein
MYNTGWLEKTVFFNRKRYYREWFDIVIFETALLHSLVEFGVLIMA